jgi:predicted flap endonuclease-1-like 5' DNA nuclease
MEPVTVIAIIGGIALLAAFAGGGGITIKDFVLPALDTMPRVACGLVGVLLLGIVIWIEWPRPVSPAVEIIPTAQATSPPLSPTNTTAPPTDTPQPLPTQMSGPPPAHCVDINRAGADELQQIVHIGPDLAGQIINLRAQRPFASVDELTRVSGIGPARLSDINAQGLACVLP